MESRAGPQKCPECGLVAECEGTEVTLVGYWSEPPHNHDDNCLNASYLCENGHRHWVHHQRKCPVEGCDWIGKLTCFCHPGQKVGIWTNKPK